MKLHRVLLPSLVFLLSVCSVLAQDWTITTADFQTRPAAFRGLSTDGAAVTWLASQQQATIPFDQFVSAQRSIADAAPTESAFTLVMRGGDRLGGEPGPVVGEQLTWISPALGKILVPFNRLICINRGANPSVPDDAAKQDTVTLSNGDAVSGVFSNCADGKVALQTDNGATSIPLETVKRIVFAATGPAAVDSSRAFRIHLTDATVITVADASLDGSKLKLALRGKNAPVLEIPFASVTGVEQLNGPVGWLSSLTPIENVQTPYLVGGTSWPARFDLSVDGSPLSFDDIVYNHGIGVHAYSRLVFAIDPQWKFFRTQYAIHSRRDDPRRYADVTVRIKLDDKVAREELHVRAGVLSPVVELDLNGAKTLTLECDFGPAGDTQAHLDWLESALLHEHPTPPTPATATATAPATQP
jgi:hypothetical protein